MDQQNQQWQADLQQEQQPRREAEDLVAHRSSEIVQLKTEKQNLAQQLEAIPGFVSAKFAELVRPLLLKPEQLRPLKVWADHPCSKCGKPAPGVTTREVAAELLRDGRYSHGDCARKWSWW